MVGDQDIADHGHGRTGAVEVGEEPPYDLSADMLVTVALCPTASLRRTFPAVPFLTADTAAGTGDAALQVSGLGPALPLRLQHDLPPLSATAAPSRCSRTSAGDARTPANLAGGD